MVCQQLWYRRLSLPPDEITSETMDHAHGVSLTDDEEHVLIERVRHGDQQAREDLFSYLQGIYWRYARRSKWVKELDISDLVQEALLMALIKLPQALKHRNPLAYLTTVGYKTMRAYCYEYQGIMTRKIQTRVASLPVVSLDQPLRRGHDGRTTTLAEHLTSSSSVYDTPQQRDYTALYEALERVGNKRREVIIRLSGLFGNLAETIQDIAGGPVPCHHPAYRRVHEAWREGLKRLRRLLQEAYHEKQMTPCSLRELAPHVDVQITPAQRARLDRAYDALQAAGQPITHTRLQQEAHVYASCIRTYLKQRAGPVFGAVS